MKKGSFFGSRHMIRSLPSKPPTSPDVLHPPPRKSLSFHPLPVLDVPPPPSRQELDHPEEEEVLRVHRLPEGPRPEWVHPSQRGLLRPNPRSRARQTGTGSSTSPGTLMPLCSSTGHLSDQASQAYASLLRSPSSCFSAGAKIKRQTGNNMTLDCTRL